MKTGDRRSRPFQGLALATILGLTAACTSTPAAQDSTAVSAPTGSSSSAPTSSSLPVTTSAPASTPVQASAPVQTTAPASTPVQTSAVSPGPGASSTAGSPSSSEASAPGGSGSPAAPSSEPAVTTTIPAPGGTGNVDQTVPTRSIPTRTTAALNASAAFGTGVSASITSVEPITVTAVGPGESSGPALQLTIRLTNGTRAQISLDGVGVDLTDATGAPAIQSTSPPAKQFAGSLPAGAAADGVYVFHVATTARNPISIDLNYSTTAPIVLFRGDAS